MLTPTGVAGSTTRPASLYQNLAAEERRELQLRIGGVLHRMVEVDYANQHAVMAYTEAGLAIPPGDLYVIEGFDRTLW